LPLHHGFSAQHGGIFNLASLRSKMMKNNIKVDLLPKAFGAKCCTPEKAAFHAQQTFSLKPMATGASSERQPGGSPCILPPQTVTTRCPIAAAGDPG
jgi:hypothetical protein